MAVSIKDAKKFICDSIASTLDTLDPSGESSKMRCDRLRKMSDKEFVQYMDWWCEAEKNDRLTIFIMEFERNIEVDNIVKAAEDINVPLYEYVAMPDINGDTEDAVVCTPTRVPVGYAQPKRMPQTVFKKSSGSIKDTKRNPKTGQVTGEDKNARNSDAETYSLLSIGAKDALREFMGPRADDIVAGAQMKQQIASNGYVMLKDLESTRADKVAINSLDVAFRMQGFMTNIVYPPDYIPNAEDTMK